MIHCGKFRRFKYFHHGNSSTYDGIIGEPAAGDECGYPVSSSDAKFYSLVHITSFWGYVSVGPPNHGCTARCE